MQSEEVKKQESLQISVKEGAAANAMVGFGENYITPAILALNGNAAHVGAMQAIVGIFGPAAQMLGSRWSEKTEKKGIVMKCVTSQVFLWAAAAVLPLIAYFSLNSAFPLYVLIAVYGLIIVAGGLLHPSWFAWMGALINENERGKYLGRRSAIVGAVSLAATIIGSILLDSFKAVGLVLIGFSALFFLATAFRIVSLIYMGKMHQPKEASKKHYEISWSKYLSMRTKIGRFAVGMAAFNFALYIASPFFAVYILEELHVSYFLFTVISMGSAAWLLIFLPIVGRISDKYGNSLLLTIAGIMFAITPPMWIFISSPWGLLFGPQLLNGLANAAFNIGFTNYTYGVVKAEQRASAVAHVNVLAGVGIILGSLIGGFMLQHWRDEVSIFLAVFCLAAICRAAVTIFFLSRIKGEKGKNAPSFHFDVMHPLRSFSHNINSAKMMMSD